jgi:hypothetical protein
MVHVYHFGNAWLHNTHNTTHTTQHTQHAQVGGTGDPGCGTQVGGTMVMFDYTVDPGWLGHPGWLGDPGWGTGWGYDGNV